MQRFQRKCTALRRVPWRDWLYAFLGPGRVARPNDQSLNVERLNVASDWRQRSSRQDVHGIISIGDWLLVGGSGLSLSVGSDSEWTLILAVSDFASDVMFIDWPICG